MPLLKILLPFLFFLTSPILFAQKNHIPDSLKMLSYKDIVKRYYKYEKDSLKTKLYAKAYLEKGKMENNDIRIAEGYHFMSEVYSKNNFLKLVYIDSIIYKTKDLNTDNYPSLAYIIKGGAYYDNREFNKSLDYYLIAYKYAEKNKNQDLIFEIKVLIGFLKKRLGYNLEAYNILKECELFLRKKKNEPGYIDGYLNVLFSLSDCYVRLNKLDSASINNIKGYDESIKAKKYNMSSYFVLEEGVNLFFKKRYKASIDSISKSLSTLIKLNDQPNLAMSYYYLGRDYNELNEIQKSVEYFIKVDEIFDQINDLHPDIRKGYEILIDYYKLQNDIKKQLYYIEKLLKLDNILNANYRYLSKKIGVDYDTHILISEKEEIIKDLDNSKIQSIFRLIILIVFVIILAGFLIFYYRKNRSYKRSFEKLLEIQNTSEVIKNVDNENKQVVKSLGSLQKSIIDTILLKLEVFEKELLFLNRDCTVIRVAKDFETNSTYLSKVINNCKGKNFTTYINELRIDYAINKIKCDAKFRRYTISAIADEVGFNNAESFSKAFYKKTGIYPSYFINNLNSK